MEDINQELEDVQKLIKIYKRRLQKLKEKEAMSGLHTPAETLLEIEDTEEKLEALNKQLDDLNRKIDELATPIVIPPASPNQGDVEPFDPDDLESPEGVVDLESPFYIERRNDKQLKRQISKLGTTTTIIGARQMGKTSLLMRGIQVAREKNSSIIFFDFQMVPETELRELNNFLHHLALNIATQVGVSMEQVEAVWQLPHGPKERLTRFLEDSILQNTSQNIILAVDEADKLAKSDSFRREFFSLMRAWHSMRGYNPLWKKINIVMVISTEPYLLINDVNQSPFNVGTQSRLKNFSLQQVQDLNNLHGQPLIETELEEMMTWLGGLPYLVRKAFYTLVDEELSWPELRGTATQPFGPFGAHLRQYTQILRDQPQLVETIKNILKNQPHLDEMNVHRLISAGLVDQQGKHYKFHCQLYDQYFRDMFS